MNRKEIKAEVERLEAELAKFEALYEKGGYPNNVWFTDKAGDGVRLEGLPNAQMPYVVLGITEEGKEHLAYLGVEQAQIIIDYLGEFIASQN